MVWAVTSNLCKQVIKLFLEYSYFPSA